MKKFAQFILLAFVIGSLGYWAWGNFTRQGSSPPSEAAPDAPGLEAARQTEPTVVVTYFTTDARCESCRTIETLARSTVEEDFARDLAAGTIRFQTINLDEPANRHFARNYSLAFKTVVVSQEAGGRVLRWGKLDDVWSLLGRPDEFRAYLAGPIRGYLAKPHD